MKRCFLLAATLVALPFSATAEVDGSESYFPQQMSARELMQACASSSLTRIGRERKRYCHGFVSGVEEAIRLAQQLDSSGKIPMLCVPGDKSSREFAEVYMRFAARKGVDLEKAAALVTLEALENAYPCPSKAAQ